MNILLDTHILLWALSNDKKLPEKARELIESRKMKFIIVFLGGDHYIVVKVK